MTAGTPDGLLSLSPPDGSTDIHGDFGSCDIRAEWGFVVAALMVTPSGRPPPPPPLPDPLEVLAFDDSGNCAINQVRWASALCSWQRDRVTTLGCAEHTCGGSGHADP